MESYLRDELEKQAKSLKAPPHPQVNAGFWHHREHSEMWSMPWHLTAGGILGNIHSIGEECRVCSICLSNITANLYCEQNDEIFPLFTTFQSLFFFISAEKKKKHLDKQARQKTEHDCDVFSRHSCSRPNYPAT